MEFCLWHRFLLCNKIYRPLPSKIKMKKIKSKTKSLKNHPFFKRKVLPPKPPFRYRFNVAAKRFLYWFMPNFLRPFRSRDNTPKKPETLRNWGVLYYGEGSSGKTLHQAFEMQKIFRYWHWLYKKFPHLKRGIIMTNQVLTPAATKGNEEFYYHFDDGEEMRFCPRKNCWRGDKKHMLHGAVVILDDVSTFLPPDNWQNTPLWMRKQWSQCGHLGIHFLFNCQDPLAYDINARRQTRLAFGFQKIFGNRRPDETDKPIKKIWGMYIRRKIKARWLWQFGDLEAEQINELKEGLKAQAELRGQKRTPFRGIWKRTYHFISKYKAGLYDTLQDVKEYEPAGYVGSKEYSCIDEDHNHIDKDAPNYTKFKKSDHELV